MCGIVGYVGGRDAVPVLVEGLSRLEYRGYDSAGIAILGSKGTQVYRRVGRVDPLGTHLAILRRSRLRCQFPARNRAGNPRTAPPSALCYGE